MLSSIQKEIEATYRISCPFSVDEFLLDETDRREFKNSFPGIHSSSETLLIHQNDDEIHVGLLFDSRLLEWSKKQDWNAIIDESSTQSPSPLLLKITPLIEGVSHFVYLLWRVEREEPVTQLELELQAEVDKFVLLSRIEPLKKNLSLIEGLFHDQLWRDDLAPHEKERYETAAELASKYCYYLRKHYYMSSHPEALFPEIRSFYRMSQAEKIRHIRQ